MTDALNDITLLEAFQKKDAVAEKMVFQRLFRPLCVYAEDITGHLGVAEDIVVEAMEKAWNCRDEFASFINLQRFLYRIVRNAGIDHTRAERRHNRAHAQILYLNSKDTDTGSILDNEILQADILQEIYTEIENLPDRCGEIFKLLFFQGFSTQEIADRLSLNVQTIRSQKARAIQLLKTQLLKKNHTGALLLLYVILKNT